METPEFKPRLPVESILPQDRYRCLDPAELGVFELMVDCLRDRGNRTRRSDWSTTTSGAWASS